MNEKESYKRLVQERKRGNRANNFVIGSCPFFLIAVTVTILCTYTSPISAAKPTTSAMIFTRSIAGRIVASSKINSYARSTALQIHHRSSSLPLKYSAAREMTSSVCSLYQIHQGRRNNAASLLRMSTQMRMYGTLDGNNENFLGEEDRQKQVSGIRQRRTRKKKLESNVEQTQPTGTKQDGDGENVKNFRDDFQGTRVFVQGLPSHTTWQELKDHFKIAGDVVFASVSVDDQTGISKNCGVVQFETTEMARIAIKIMRDYPLDGEALYVRPDYQEQRKGRSSVRPRSNNRGGLASTWRCADEEKDQIMMSEEVKPIIKLIEARDAARRRKDYDLSDSMREELKIDYGVHLDDRLKLWWIHREGGGVPDMVSEIKGDGRWGAQRPWRQIPTTPESDSCVNPDLVSALLKQRDNARQEKDFYKADTLLEEARNAPDGDLTLKINDEKRTWRVWTEEKPPTPAQFTERNDQALSAYDQCIHLVSRHDPEKVDEVKNMLRKFPGKELAILEKLKGRYNLK